MRAGAYLEMKRLKDLKTRNESQGCLRAVRLERGSLENYEGSCAFWRLGIPWWTRCGEICSSLSAWLRRNPGSTEAVVIGWLIGMPEHAS